MFWSGFILKWKSSRKYKQSKNVYLLCSSSVKRNAWNVNENEKANEQLIGALRKLMRSYENGVCS